MNYLDTLRPSSVWSHFLALSQIPRGSGKEEAASHFVAELGHAHGLETYSFANGNVIVRKPATPGMENRPMIALQSHLDMVQVAQEGVAIDFDQDPIVIKKSGDWISADGTTLGADNGIEVAMTLAILTTADHPHPPIEALFTVDEEVGMSGAAALRAGDLKAGALINLDSEEDDVLMLGCAGAIDVIIEARRPTEPCPAENIVQAVTVSGGKGGHSGVHIHLGRANAIFELARVLRNCSGLDLTLKSLTGGQSINAIPSEAVAVISIPEDQLVPLQKVILDADLTLKDAYPSDPGLSVSLAATTADCVGFRKEDSTALLKALCDIPSGIVAMREDIEGVVETSNSVGLVSAKAGHIKVACLARSCVDTELAALVENLRCAAGSFAEDLRTENAQPAWEPQGESVLAQAAAAAYRSVNGHEMRREVIHAGLECGVLSAIFPHIEMISYGPTILDVHSPDERISVSSVKNCWSVLLETLANIPPKEVAP
ncbi:MAG: beta-Ala-His dipeptidase [Boseongicola sp.]|nr:MAG: beta-Ala-His dipeptidase [Boseongicola sp.]